MPTRIDQNKSVDETGERTFYPRRALRLEDFSFQIPSVPYVGPYDLNEGYYTTSARERKNRKDKKK